MHPSRQIALVVAAIVAIVAAVPLLRPSRPAPAQLGAPEDARELVVMIHPGAVTWFPGPDGSPVGLDADLLRRFAAEQGLPLRVVMANGAAELSAAIARGDAHLGAGGLLRPLPVAAAIADRGTSTPSTATVDAEADPAAALRWGRGYFAVEPVLICNGDGYRPASWSDLDGETVAYVPGAGLDADIVALTVAHPRVRYRAVDPPNAVGLVAQVSDGTIGYAIVGSLAAAAARNVYLGFEVAFPVGDRRDVAWIVAPRFTRLHAQIDAFLERAQRDGTLARLVARYLPDAPSFERVDATALAESMRTVLPQWRATFHDAQERTDVEWRLLAAIAYQESKWDQYATSETGVRGFMQITEDTARQLGITNLLDPAQNVLGAARYLSGLKAKLPARIVEPDRTWLALAAFNIGLGHLEDARVLAQRQKLDPDLWSDVRRALPLLALPEYHADAKNGYARGGMPVAFVDRVRAYYDILLAHEPPLQPRLRMYSDVGPKP